MDYTLYFRYLLGQESACGSRSKVGWWSPETQQCLARNNSREAMSGVSGKEGLTFSDRS